MKKKINYILIASICLLLNSCGGGDSPFFEVDNTAPVIAEVTAVTTPTNDNTPNYTFSSTESGSISFEGSCSSSTTSADSGDNTITLNSLSDGTYSDCAITVSDKAANESNLLILTSFFVDSTASTLVETNAIASSTNDSTPDYTFVSSEAGTITYSGSCSSSTTTVIAGTNTITFGSLSDGTYSDCKIIVTDSIGNSVTMNISSFTVSTTPNNLTATGATGQVTLDWSAMSGVNSYTVYWDNSTGVSSSSNSITSISSDNYTHSGLDNGTIYYYKVAAVFSDNTTGPLSSEVSATTPLPAPDNLTASGANNTVTLTWNAVSGATSYTLYWDNSSGIDSSDTAITSITNDNYTHSNLDNGSTYYYKVAAVNSSGTGTLSSVASALLSADLMGSETNEGHTYALTSSTMTWNEAANAAAALGGYLTTINTRAENTWLFDKFGKYGGTNRDLWIGAKDDVSEGSWYWDNGTTSGDGGVSDNISAGSTWPDGQTKWASGEPNNAGNEDCGTIRGVNNTEKWNDLGCSSNLYGIIEIE